MKNRVLFFSFILFFCLFFISGCTTKKCVMKMEEFHHITETNEYVFSDVSDQFVSDEKILGAAMASTTVWHVEYYVLDTEENANDMFESNRISFRDTMISTSSEKENRTRNSNTYQLITSSEFMYLCQVENTLLYARVPVEYRSRVLKFIQQLNY